MHYLLGSSSLHLPLGPSQICPDPAHPLKRQGALVHQAFHWLGVHILLCTQGTFEQLGPGCARGGRPSSAGPLPWVYQEQALVTGKKKQDVTDWPSSPAAPRSCSEKAHRDADSEPGRPYGRNRQGRHLLIIQSFTTAGSGAEIVINQELRGSWTRTKFINDVHRGNSQESFCED